MSDRAQDSTRAGRIDSEMAKRLGEIGNASESAAIGAHFDRYSRYLEKTEDYSSPPRRLWRETVRAASRIAFVTMLLPLAASSLYFVIFDGWLNYGRLATGFAAAFVVAVLASSLRFNGSLRNAREHRTILLGSGKNVRDSLARLGNSREMAHVIGACIPENDEFVDGWSDLSIPILGNLSELRQISTGTQATHCIVVPESGLSGADVMRAVRALESVRIHLLSSVVPVDLLQSRIASASIAGMCFVRIKPNAYRGLQRFVQGILDRAFAAILLLALAPLLLAVALTIRLDSSGPVLFRQVRVGYLGERFVMYKFRTMFSDAEERKFRLLESTDGVLFKMRMDPRITRVGAVLRRYSIDELPQLINVLSGKMSFVGPRPPFPAEVETYGNVVRRRLLVKPGLTGLWQVSGRSDLSWEEAVRLDLSYVDNWSLRTNFDIISRTFYAVARGTGAY